MQIAGRIAGNPTEIIGVLGLLLRTFRIGWKTKTLGLQGREAAVALGLNEWSWRNVSPVVNYALPVIAECMDSLTTAAADIKAGRGSSRDFFILAIGKVIGCLSVKEDTVILS